MWFKISVIIFPIDSLIRRQEATDISTDKITMAIGSNLVLPWGYWYRFRFFIAFVDHQITTPDVISIPLSTKLEMTDIDPDSLTATTFAINKQRLTIKLAFTTSYELFSIRSCLNDVSIESSISIWISSNVSMSSFCAL